MARGLPTFIVEGHLEQEFFQKHCGKKVKVLKIPNGEDVSPKALAKQINALSKILPLEPEFIFVVIDRERRKQSSLDIEMEIKNELLFLGLKTPFSIHIPDIMIENWILADPKVFLKYGLKVTTPNGTEGVGGKKIIATAYQNIKKNYKERFEGVQLLSDCSAKEMNENSISFSRLYSALKLFNVKCHWLNK
jgi:hypothetical protein